MRVDAILDLIGWLALRAGIGFVYLFALYKNVQNSAARRWLVEHTAFMFPSLPEPRRTQLARVCAAVGAGMMLSGGVMILFGIEGRIGALLLLSFTALGIYQHKRECEVATALGQKLAGEVPDTAKTDVSTLQWSGFSGNFSSGLKNWALCGTCVALFCWGTGPHSITLSDRIIPAIFGIHK